MDARELGMLAVDREYQDGGRGRKGGYWPLCADGALDPNLYSDSHLEDALFNNLARHFKCSPSDIGGALKALVKKHHPALLKELSKQPSLRNQRLAHLSGNLATIRGSLKDISIRNTAGLRRGRARLPINPKLRFQEVLWSAYCSDPARLDLTKWIKKHAVSRKEIGSGHFLSVSHLNDDQFINEVPGGHKSLEFSQSIVLFAALLPEQEAREFLEKARDIGCFGISNLLELNLDTSSVDELRADADSDSECQAYPIPKMGGNAHSNDAEGFSGEYLELENFKRTDLACQSLKTSARAQLAEKISQLLEMPAERFEGAMALVSDLRRKIAETEAARALLHDKLNSENLWIKSILDFEVLASERLSWTDSHLIDVSADIHYIVKVLRGNAARLAAIKARIAGSVTSGNASELASVLKQLVDDLAWIESAKIYAEELRSWIVNAPSGSAIENEIGNLRPEDAIAVACSVDAAEWPLLISVLLRHYVDSDGASPVLRMLTQGHLASGALERRRSDLYFLSPSACSDALDASLRRSIALEYIRDALEFGPLAKLAEPHGFLRDSVVVGHVIPEILVLLCSSSDRIRSSLDTSRLLRQSGDRAAARALKAFISAPPSMAGMFKRLKEKAREMFLMPLVVDGVICVDAALALAANFDEIMVLDDVVNSLAIEKGADLEARHKDALRRYISRAKLLLDDFRQEQRGAHDARDLSIREALVRLQGRLNSAAGSAEIRWIESEVSDLLSGRATVPEVPTLQGEGLELIMGGRLNVEQIDFVRSQADLACAYQDPMSLKGIELVKSVMRAWASNSPPSSENALQELLDLGNLAAARSLVNYRGGSLVERLQLYLTPQLLELKAKHDVLQKTFGVSSVNSCSELTGFESALRRFDIDGAKEALALMDFNLSQRKEADRRNAVDEARRDQLLVKFESALVRVPDETDLEILEARWTEMKSSSVERWAHLQRVCEDLRGIVKSLPEIVAKFSSFSDLSDDPNYWIDPSVSSDFVAFSCASSTKIMKWIENGHLLRAEERRSLSHLCEWYMGFIGDSSRTIRGIEDDDSVASVLGRVMEVDDCIERAEAPSISITNLADMGEVISGVAEIGRQSEPVLALERDGSGGSDFESLPGDVARAICLMNWEEAIRLGTEWSGRLEASDSQFLTRVVESASLLGDSDRPMQHADPQALEFSAGLVGARIGRGSQLSEADRADLAKRVIVMAIRSESVENIREKSWSWSDLLAKSSQLKRALTVGSEGLASRVIAIIFSGLACEAVARQIWDSATNLSDAAGIRSSILLRLSDLDSHATIVRLIMRADPAVAVRVQQLFELRSIVSNRPDLVPVVHGLTEQISSSAKSAPVRAFLRQLPSVNQSVGASLDVRADGDIRLSIGRGRIAKHDFSVAVSPSGLVPERLEAMLLDNDDVTFADGSMRVELSSRPVYVASEYPVCINFGLSWGARKVSDRSAVRLRVRARLITGELVSSDIEIPVGVELHGVEGLGVLDDESLLDAYPGVTNTPAVDEVFIGRFDEIEALNKLLVVARRPSPVLLVGLRRIGKTSLLFAFHNRYRKSVVNGAVSVYLSLAERRIEIVEDARTISEVIYRSIVHSIVRPNLSATDQNSELASRVRSYFSGDWKVARAAMQDCFDDESLADSIIGLRSMLSSILDSHDLRLVLLIDEAEALAAAYNLGGRKRAELEQFLQSLREVSQRTGEVAVLLSGSNHINVFAREYRNAFFGSSQVVNLGGLKREDAPQLVGPARLAAYVRFDESAIDYVFGLCDGMPQFMWQLGAAAAYHKKSGIVSRADVRAAISVLNEGESHRLPFRLYDFLEPVDSILALEDPRERDLLWMLLFKIANSSSLISENAALAFVLDQSLSAIDDREAWHKRCAKLVDLGLVRMPAAATLSFRVPLFAEGFRAPKNWQEFNIRQQKVTK